ncbi:hypothetical protein Vi05172_g10363 [Venturia inaequalis]|uniref:DUF7492 domain-containing protein n=1 Tax=Venturia inaequalis TaxID=5025 RepID=A0A8H3VQD7_VENIN|nr:hypothetical protein EG327_010192 [Venturia inaequalis]RDI79536.1 hypothetical protein Vi05172_g10363 [Venturia inaequalis]
MKNIIAATAALVSAVSAHSWVECANHDNAEMLGWMKGNSTLNPPTIIDPAMPWYSQYCKGWPRNKANPGNWIDESTNYIWNIAAQRFNMGAQKPSDTHACNANQRSPTYLDGAPMTTAAPGDMIRLRYGGNGHTRGYNAGFEKGPGNVTVYWKGAPEQEITDISEFTAANTLQSQAFAANSFSYPADKSITSPEDGLVDKGNWFELNLPKNMAAGRHMMVWVWAYNGADQWSTCFDVMISGSASKNPVSSASSPAYAAPAVASTKAAATSKAPAIVVPPVQNAIEPATTPVSSPTPTPAPAAPVVPVVSVAPGGAFTVTEWDTVWETDYVVETAVPQHRGRRHAHKRHARQF